MTHHSDGSLPPQRTFAGSDTVYQLPLVTTISRITDRQLECLSWVQEGKSASDIGAILGLSGRTVEKHLIKLCGHLGVKTRVQAVVLARERGLISGPRRKPTPSE